MAEDSKSALSHFCTLSITRGAFDENTYSPASERTAMIPTQSWFEQCEESPCNRYYLGQKTTVMPTTPHEH